MLYRYVWKSERRITDHAITPLPAVWILRKRVYRQEVLPTMHIWSEKLDSIGSEGGAMHLVCDAGYQRDINSNCLDNRRA